MPRIQGWIALGARTAFRAGMALGALAWTSACAPSVVWFGKSPDRRHEARIIERSGEQRVRVDGRDEKAFDGIAVEALEWSPDGRHLAYAAQRGNSWLVVRDGKEGAEYDGIGEIVWSEGGGSLAYAAQRGNSWHVVFNGREGPPFDAILAGSIRPSPDGKHIAYAAERQGSIFVFEFVSIDIEDGRLFGPFDGVGKLAWSADRTIFVARRGERARLVVGGSELAEHDAITEVALSSKGSRFAYAAANGNNSFVIEGNTSHPPFDRVADLLFSLDGRHLAYIAGRGDGDERVVKDGVLGPQFDVIQRGSLVFSPDGERLAYVGRRAEMAHAVLNGVSGPPFRRIDAPVFGGNGERFGYVGRRKKRSIVVIDGRESIPYEWAGDLVFSPDGKRHAYLAHRNGQPMVAHDDRRSAFDFVIEGSLVFGAGGDHWACIIGIASARRLYIAVDGTPRVPVDLEELTAALMKPVPTARGGAVTSTMLRTWVSAELDKITRPRSP